MIPSYSGDTEAPRACVPVSCCLQVVACSLPPQQLQDWGQRQCFSGPHTEQGAVPCLPGPSVTHLALVLGIAAREGTLLWLQQSHLER